MNITEVKSWAKKHGFVVKKQGEGYVWWGEGVAAGEPAFIEDVAKQIYNRLTDGKFEEYQRGFEGLK